METEDLLKISFNLFIDEENEDKNEKKPDKKDQFKPSSLEEEWFMKQPSTSAAQTIKYKADLLYFRRISLIFQKNFLLNRFESQSIIRKL